VNRRASRDDGEAMGKNAREKGDTETDDGKE
jgi:hypothetical protein